MTRKLTVMGGRKYNRYNRRKGLLSPRNTQRPSSFLNIKELNQFKQIPQLETKIEKQDIVQVIDWINQID